MIDDDVWGPVHDEDQPCRTSNGVEIKVGLRVIDYDRKQAVVTEEPRRYGGKYDPVCWSQAGHGGHWWQTNTGTFDGSRMTTRGAE
jgi:hypothetical protein